jgi:hypothetical protein
MFIFTSVSDISRAQRHFSNIRTDEAQRARDRSRIDVRLNRAFSLSNEKLVTERARSCHARGQRR